MKTIEERDGFVCVWAGDLSADELAEYRSEHDSDEGWTSAFAEDLGRVYDHDFLGMEAAGSPTPIAVLLERLGYTRERYPNLVGGAVDAAGAQEFSAMLVLWNVRANKNIERARFARGRLRFLGSFEQALAP